jgi:Arc/MetJ-type ribon-helix-helix transcriptional regulator
MRNVATSVRVNRHAHSLLEDLCSKTKQSKAELIERALRDLEERMFWQEVHDAFAKPETSEMRAERALWDRTASDGFGKKRK